MLRTLIVRLLIVFTLLANLGWATDMYVGDGAADTSPVNRLFLRGAIAMSSITF